MDDMDVTLKQKHLTHVSDERVRNAGRGREKEREDKEKKKREIGSISGPHLFFHASPDRLASRPGLAPPLPVSLPDASSPVAVKMFAK